MFCGTFLISFQVTNKLLLLWMSCKAEQQICELQYTINKVQNY